MTAHRIVVVTGGGGGIGAAIAEELGRQGDFVVTMDPLVSVDGSAPLPPTEETTADRIVAAGGAARASSVSVTDGAAVSALFAALVDEFGRLDAVVNVAGISRPTSFTGGSEHDWHSVLSVHLDGYLNVLAAALPIMAAAGRGQVLGVTSGSGWRAADTGAYGCAKRAVASLTWQMGTQAPPGVVVNAVSPIAMTRMVTAALERAPSGGPPGATSTSTGGLALSSMPTPEQLGPIGAHLVSDDISWCQGQVVFAGGSEVALIDPPRLLEVVRIHDAPSLASVLESTSLGALVPAEALQASTGGSNPRFGALFDRSSADDLPPPAVTSCLVVSDRPELTASVAAALDRRGVATGAVAPGEAGSGFGASADALTTAAVEVGGPVEAVVVALAGPSAPGGASSGWERLLAEHAGIVDHIRTDAGWARAVADHASRSGRPIRLVTLTDAMTGGGRSRAQAAAQLARAAGPATGERVAAFAVSVETAVGDGGPAIGDVVAHLVTSPDAWGLSGAELVVGVGWLGLRSHPRAGASITFGGPDLPEWLDDTLATMVATSPRPAGDDHRPPATEGAR